MNDYEYLINNTNHALLFEQCRA